jgi:hypothetical protein
VTLKLIGPIRKSRIVNMAPGSQFAARGNVIEASVFGGKGLAPEQMFFYGKK